MILTKNLFKIASKVTIIVTMQVTTFFKYWLNTSEYYHNTYEYCHNTSKYFAGEYTPRTLQFFISVLRILFVKGYCLKCLELDNWTKLKLVKWINYNQIWHLVSLHHIWFTDIIRKHFHFKLIICTSFMYLLWNKE